METVDWKVEGMSCANCVLTISKYLQKQGMQDVKINLISGDLHFSMEGTQTPQDIQRGIESLGYQVSTGSEALPGKRKKWMSTHLEKFLFCLVFSLPLLWMHLPVGPLHVHWLMNPYVQLTFCIPVYMTGMNYFGRSALKSLSNGLPNMNVLIAIGSTAAFVYSLAGMLLHLGPNYIFFETAALIITLIFFGNYIEELTIRSTQIALNGLARTQQVMANMIAFDDKHQEQIFPVESSQLRSGDIILIRSGEQVPADCKILWGDASVNESIVTGESLPLEKHAKDLLIGGSLLCGGTVKAQVTAAAQDSVLSNIVNLVKQAQGEKPPVQQMADRISAVFVPVVLLLSAGAFLANYLWLHDLTTSVMRSIAVLVIACPCAMGLATPAAIAVGLGRAARNGILFRNARSLELFKNIRQVVFDKTGTLSTGDFRISTFRVTARDLSEEEFKRLVFSIEKYSNHPIAKSIAKSWKSKNEWRWKKIEELKGMGMRVESKEGDQFLLGSYSLVKEFTTEQDHHVYLVRNKELLGWLEVEDELRPEAPEVIRFFQRQGIKTILLSGDRLDKCTRIAGQLGMDEVIAEQSPQQKLDKISALHDQFPTAMVGDGINDAPALARATIGISMSDASHIAIQTADVVLMNKGIRNLPMALGLGKHTFTTIQQNLFWAFFYNIIAIPFAAVGFLSPTVAALVMGLSDVVLAANSLRLYIKKVV